MSDESGKDTKIIAVPHNKLTNIYDNIKNISDFPEYLKQQIQHFFENYKTLYPGKWVKVEKWLNKEFACTEITKAIKNYQKN